MNMQLSAAIIATFAPLLPLVVYWITRKNQDVSMRYLWFLILAGFLSDFIGMTNFWIRSMPLRTATSTCYFFLNAYLMVFFYQKILPGKFHRLIFLALPLLVVVWGYFMFLGDLLYAAEKANIGVGILTVIFSLIYFYTLLVEMPTVVIQKLPLFWINTGFLIYYASTLLLFIVSDYMFNHGQAEKVFNFWIFHNLISVTQNILFAIGLWQVTRKTQLT